MRDAHSSRTEAACTFLQAHNLFAAHYMSYILAKGKAEADSGQAPMGAAGALLGLDVKDRNPRGRGSLSANMLFKNTTPRTIDFEQ